MKIKHRIKCGYYIVAAFALFIFSCGGSETSGTEKDDDFDEIPDILQDDYERILFEDEVFELCVRDVLKVHDRDINTGDVEFLTTLDCTNYDRDEKIKFIKGIEYFQALKKLNFTGNLIEDVSPLSKLYDLEQINLSVNEISDISALKDLKSLKDVGFTSNNISDISVIVNWIKLKMFAIGYNKITEIPSLKDLPDIEDILLQNNNIRDISALSGVTTIKRVSLGHNSIEKGLILNNMSSLEVLDVQFNKISDISGLINLPSLKVLDLNNNELSQINNQTILQGLTALFLRTNKISDISGLKDLKNIEELSIAYNYITDISPVAGLENLEKLEVSNNCILDFSSIQHLIEKGIIADSMTSQKKMCTEKQECTGLPDYAHWNTVSEIYLNWDGEDWVPSTEGFYSEDSSEEDCRFKCDNFYEWNESTGMCFTNYFPWLDTDTGFAWSECPINLMSWAEAFDYCENLEYGGCSDWFLPTISNLRTLIKDCPSAGECNIHENSCIEWDCRDHNSCYGCFSDDSGIYSKIEDSELMWSSTERLSVPEVWVIDFSRGGVFTHQKIFKAYVRCASENCFDKNEDI